MVLVDLVSHVQKHRHDSCRGTLSLIFRTPCCFGMFHRCGARCNYAFEALLIHFRVDSCGKRWDIVWRIVVQYWRNKYERCFHNAFFFFSFYFFPLLENWYREFFIIPIVIICFVEDYVTPPCVFPIFFLTHRYLCNLV